MLETLNAFAELSRGTPRAVPAAMRIAPSVFALALFAPGIAAAHPTGGGSSGGGRLGQVSGGLGNATGGSGGGSHGGGGSYTPPPPPLRDDSGGEQVYVDGAPVVAGAVVVGGGVTAMPAPAPAPDGGTAKFEAYIGAEDVHESDGAFTLELGIRDRLFRIGGSVTRYYERQLDGSQLTLTVPALIGGIRIDDGGATRAYLELGITGAKTHNDPVMDSSITGGLGGVRVEHALTRSTTLLGTLHEMVFQDHVRAHSGTIGLKWGALQASFRILDFNVGPALYGPELGLRF